MGLALKDNTVKKYLNFLTKLDNLTKKKLIIKLTESMEFDKKETFNLKAICGTWEDTRSSDEIIADIKTARVEKINAINL